MRDVTVNRPREAAQVGVQLSGLAPKLQWNGLWTIDTRYVKLSVGCTGHIGHIHCTNFVISFVPAK